MLYKYMFVKFVQSSLKKQNKKKNPESVKFKNFHLHAFYSNLKNKECVLVSYSHHTQVLLRSEV